MIAKIVASTGGKSGSFGYSARYILDMEGCVSDPLSWSRTADYALNDGGRSDRVHSWRISNCRCDDDPAVATAEVLATQARNTRARSARHMHLVVSFPAGETPDKKTLHRIEDDLVASIGLEAHQRLSVVHTDTDHLHMHVVVNKIHPETYCIVDPYQSQRKLMRACHELEVEYGLEKTPHGLEKGQLLDLAESFMVRERAAVEQHCERRKLDDVELTLREGALEIVSGEAGQQAREKAHDTEVALLTRERLTDAAVEKAQLRLAELGEDPQWQGAYSWGEFYRCFVERGLEVVSTPHGLAIGQGRDRQLLSGIDRQVFSMGSLTAHLGDYHAPERIVREFVEQDFIRECQAEHRDRVETAVRQELTGPMTELEHKTGERSLVSWAKAQVAEPALALVAAARGPNSSHSWEDLHGLLGGYGLVIKPRGAGLVIGCRLTTVEQAREKADTRHHPDKWLFIKASSVDRGLSKGNLERVFGAWQPSVRSLLSENAQDGYRAERARENAARESETRVQQERERQDMAVREVLLAEACKAAKVILARAVREPSLTGQAGWEALSRCFAERGLVLIRQGDELGAVDGKGTQHDLDGFVFGSRNLMRTLGYYRSPKLFVDRLMASDEVQKTLAVNWQRAAEALSASRGEHTREQSAPQRELQETLPQYSRQPVLGSADNPLWGAYQQRRDESKKARELLWASYRERREMLLSAYEERFGEIRESGAIRFQKRNSTLPFHRFRYTSLITKSVWINIDQSAIGSLPRSFST